MGPIPACTGEPCYCVAAVIRPRAYPRMHGGTLAVGSHMRGLEGLSPHARGNRHRHASAGPGIGPIPACTGEPLNVVESLTASGAYPRMHGGTLASNSRALASAGLSPHARGNPGCVGADVAAEGPIPACTGEPIRKPLALWKNWAYPRMHGGTDFCPTCGSSKKGLSPHARGNLESNRRPKWIVGPIPACTGEPLDHKSLIQKANSLFQFNF